MTWFWLSEGGRMQVEVWRTGGVGAPQHHSGAGLRAGGQRWLEAPSRPRLAGECSWGFRSH